MTHVEALQAAFRNWWLPAILVSAAYRLRRFRRLRQWMLNRELRLRTRSGPTVVARLRDVGGPTDVFGAREYSLASVRLPDVQFVVDLGAHVGSFSLWALSSSRCSVLAIEPDPDTFEMLRRNLQQFGDRARCFQAAVAGQSGRRILRVAEDTAASVLEKPDSAAVIDGHEVRAMTLDEVFELAAFPRIDVLKIDIEGAEYEVVEHLAEGTLNRVETVLIECHGREPRAADGIADIMRREGFDVSSKRKSVELLVMEASRRAKSRQGPIDAGEDFRRDRRE
jgi:FkbM family methyltransferase